MVCAATLITSPTGFSYIIYLSFDRGTIGSVVRMT